MHCGPRNISSIMRTRRSNISPYRYKEGGVLERLWRVCGVLSAARCRPPRCWRSAHSCPGVWPLYPFQPMLVVTTSAVEGRNSALAQLHHEQRGLPKQWYQVWTVLPNFDCHAADGTTPAWRFFRRAFPDLFATVFATIADLPQPRQRHQAMALIG